MEYFANHYTQTPETHKELRWKTLDWPLLIYFAIAVIGIGVALSMGIAFGVIQNMPLLVAYCVVVMVLFFIALLRVPLTTAKNVRAPKRFKNVNTVFHDDKIEIKSRKKSSAKKYESVERLDETENFFIIVLNNEESGLSFLPVKKDGLNCDPEVFKGFIAEKIASSRKVG